MHETTERLKVKEGQKIINYLTTSIMKPAKNDTITRIWVYGLTNDFSVSDLITGGKMPLWKPGSKRLAIDNLRDMTENKLLESKTSKNHKKILYSSSFRFLPPLWCYLYSIQRGLGRVLSSESKKILDDPASNAKIVKEFVHSDEGKIMFDNILKTKSNLNFLVVCNGIWEQMEKEKKK